MKFGTSYYPELIDEAEWSQDLDHMRRASVRIVRMLEFAWSALEPREGVYAFEWLDRFLDLAHSKGLEVILCTPSATPPAWLGTQYPEVYVELTGGETRRHGGRRDMDVDNETYRFYSAEIARKLGQRYGQHPAVIGWQIDNELFGVEGLDLPPGCHTPASTFRFRQYLKRVHGDIETLNRRWGTRFWSQEYSHWGEVTTPRHERSTMGQVLDYLRYFNDSLAGFLRLQYEVLREVIAPEQFVTHNATAIFDRGLDHIALQESLDVTGWDAYFGAAGNPHPEAFAALAHDLFRSAKKKPFWVLETGPMPDGRGGSPAFFAEMRAHGALGVVMWHWRGHRANAERGSAFCDVAGRPWEDRVERLQSIASREELQEEPAASLPPRKAAIMFCPDHVRVGRGPDPYMKLRKQITYLRVLIEAYHAVRQLGVPMDFVRPGDSLDDYHLLIMPAVRLLNQPEANLVKEFVARGGTLFATGKLAHDDIWAKYYPDLGEPLAEVLGLYARADAQLREGQKVRTECGEVFECLPYGDRVVVNGARVIATCEGEPWDGAPAASVNDHGQGRTFYAAVASPGLFGHLARQAVVHAGLPVYELASENAVALPHLTGEGIWVFNYGLEPVQAWSKSVAPGDFALLSKGEFKGEGERQR